MPLLQSTQVPMAHHSTAISRITILANILRPILFSFAIVFTLTATGCGRATSDATPAKDSKEVDASALPSAMTAITATEKSADELSESDDMEVTLDDADTDEAGASDPESTILATEDSAAANTDDAISIEKGSPAAPASLTTTPIEGTSGSNVAAAPETITLGEPSLTAGIPGEGALTVEQVTAWLADVKNLATLDVQLPLGLSAAASLITGIQENPMTRAKIELGRQLYFDKRLSSDGTISCASCHDPGEGYARHTQFGEGIAGKKGDRNSPSSYNRILSAVQFWDGRAATLEEQAKGPIANAIEMGSTHEQSVEKIKGITAYRLQFASIFGTPDITIDHVAQAIATFERALVTSPAPYDYLEKARAIESQYDAEELASLADDDPDLAAQYKAAQAGMAAMTESAIRGRDLFFNEKSNCTACHAGANFTDEKFHNLGVGMEAAEPDLGRFKQTQIEADRGAFKTPALRNVALSGPYMHDGSQQTLEEVVEWYAKGGHPNPYLSDKVKKLDLSEQDKKDLVAFMVEGLTSEFPAVETERLPE